MSLESVSRIEPARLEEPTGPIADAIAELAAAAATLGKALHPRTAAHLADLVRIMNTYYSNLIEGHDTRPRDIERALAGLSVRATRPVYVGRPESASPATGSARTHVKEQADLVDRALTPA